MRDVTDQLIPSHPSRPIRGGGPSPRTIWAGEIAELPLFLGVEREVVSELASCFEAFQYPVGAMVLEAGDCPTKLKVILQGIIELCRVDEVGQEHGVLLLSAKDLLMPAAVLLEEPSLVCARALTESVVLKLDAGLMRSAMSRSTQLSLNLLRVTSGQWRMAVRNILELTSRTAAQRLGAFLLRLADLQDSTAGSVPVLAIAKRNLAARLAITPETLSRTLQVNSDRGLHLRGRAIVIRDRAKLEAFCGPDPYPGSNERKQHVYAI